MEAVPLRCHAQPRELASLALANLIWTVLTFGLYHPFAKTERRQYLWRSIEVGGHRLRYHGTARELIVGWLRVASVALTLVVLWHLLRRQALVPFINWGAHWRPLAAGLWLAVAPFAIYGSRRYVLTRTSLRGVRFALVGSAWRFALWFWLGALMTVASLGVALPVWINLARRRLTKDLRYGNVRVAFVGRDRDYFLLFWKHALLLLPTLGLAVFWLAAATDRFYFNHLLVDRAEVASTIDAGDAFWLSMRKSWAPLLSCGLSRPWNAVANIAMWCRVSTLAVTDDFWSSAASLPSPGSPWDGALDGLGLDVLS